MCCPDSHGGLPVTRFHPWGISGAWREESFMHQPSRRGSEIRLALGNLTTLSVSWSIYELHFRDKCMSAAQHINFPIQKLCNGKDFFFQAYGYFSDLKTVSSQWQQLQLAAGIHICSRVFLTLLINISIYWCTHYNHCISVTSDYFSASHVLTRQPLTPLHSNISSCTTAACKWLWLQINSILSAWECIKMYGCYYSQKMDPLCYYWMHVFLCRWIFIYTKISVLWQWKWALKSA